MGVVFPGVVGGFEHRVGGAGPDAVVAGVEVEGFGSAFADADGGGGFVGVGEPVEVGELDGAGVVGEEAQCAAGFDGGELGGVAEDPDDGAAFAGVVGEPVQVAGAGHAGFVDQDEVAGLEHEPRIVGSPGRGGVVGVAELVQVLGPAAQLGAEDLGGGGGRGERDDPSTGGPPGLGDGLSAPWSCPRPAGPMPTTRRRGSVVNPVTSARCPGSRVTPWRSSKAVISSRTRCWLRAWVVGWAA